MAYLSFIGLVFWLFLFFYMVPVVSWYTAKQANLDIGIMNLIAMRLRKVPPGLIVNNASRLKQNDIDFNIQSLQVHYLKGGNVHKLTEALLKAKSNCVDLTYDEAATRELDGATQKYKK